MRNVDVFPGSNRLIHGLVPPSSLLLIGPSGVGKTIFCKHFFYNGLMLGEPCIYVTTSETPNEIETSMKAFGLDIEPYKEKETVCIVDGCSWKLGRSSSSVYAVDSQQNYLTALSIKIQKAQKNLKKVRLIFDSASELFALSNQDAVLNFLQVLTARIRLDGGKAIFTIASGAHDEHLMNLLRLIFDGILEMKMDDSGKELKRLLRIFSLKGAEHKTNWTPFEITGKGIVVKCEAELRCAMCSKVIDWEPIIKIIDGKKHSFDTIECVNTYKKFKSIYGSSFE
jgi:KaiC/GvpD/RAD55 family RecA-like ATPase